MIPIIFRFYLPVGLELNRAHCRARCLICQIWMVDGDDCGAISGMNEGHGNRSTRRKPAPGPLCRPQIPHDLMRPQTRAEAKESLRLIA
jgi:hypothetical protein